MKRTLLLSAFLFVATFASFAQTEEEEEEHAAPTFHPSHELMVGHGFLPLPHMGDRGMYNYDNIQSTGALFATYRFQATRVFSLGITAAYQNQCGNWRDDRMYMYYTSSYSGTNPITGGLGYPTGKVNRSSLTIATEMNFTYLRTRNDLMQMYSGIGLGYTFNHETFTYDGSDTRYLSADARPVAFNGQVALVGVHVGRKLGAFAELGFGYKGVINYGFSWRF